MKSNIALNLVCLIIMLTACEEGQYDYSANMNTETGTAGSLARFAISGNYLYTVDHSMLKTFNVSNEKKPEFISEHYIEFGIQTIFAKDNLLFLGAQNGIHIFDISNPEAPLQISKFVHVQSCDPVVVKGNYAYSTLNSDGPCGRGLNELDIIDISNPENPVLVNSIPMNTPKGLGISGSTLFVCDKGLKIFSLAPPHNPQLIKTINIAAVDVIPIDTLLLVATEQGLEEYSIDSQNELHFLSSLYSN